jgi:hypothetical protein
VDPLFNELAVDNSAEKLPIHIDGLAFEYRWQHPEGLGQVLGFADLDVSRQAIQALICEEGEPCGVACCCW